MLIVKRPAWLPLTLVFVALSLVSAEGIAAKCYRTAQMPGFGPNDAVVLLDGSIVPNAGSVASGGLTMDQLGIEASDIHSMEVTCWNPETGKFEGVGGVPAVRIRTKGLVESTRAPIEGLLRAQEAYFSQHSRYAHSLDDLVTFGVPRDAMLEFSATSTGWSAATPRDGVAYRCFVFSGDAPQELDGAEQHEVVCQPDAAKANPALREMYEGSG